MYRYRTPLILLTKGNEHRPISLRGDALDISDGHDDLSDLIKMIRASTRRATQRSHHDDPCHAFSHGHAGAAERPADGSSTVTSALGKRATYRLKTIQGVRRITAVEDATSANRPNSNLSSTTTTAALKCPALKPSAGPRNALPPSTPTLSMTVTIADSGRTINYGYDAQGHELGFQASSS
ncbi:hypothetical protein [Pseudomonas tohonis]|uniref:hypothetical protein n=1 Tax=Pseudomonas tohonis TaxID=2725477 RepID=UPI001F35A954|nr:hypothetical protein [Pseudomonas tohonis]